MILNRVSIVIYVAKKIGLAYLFGNEQYTKVTEVPLPAKLLKGVEENSVTQTGRLRSFRGRGE